MYIGTMDLDWNASVIAITNVNRMRHSEHSKLIETTKVLTVGAQSLKIRNDRNVQVQNMLHVMVAEYMDSVDFNTIAGD